MVCLAFKKVLKLIYEIHNKKENAEKPIKKNRFSNVAMPEKPHMKVKPIPQTSFVANGRTGEPGVCMHFFSLTSKM